MQMRSIDLPVLPAAPIDRSRVHSLPAGNIHLRKVSIKRFVPITMIDHDQVTITGVVPTGVDDCTADRKRKSASPVPAEISIAMW